MKRDWLTSAALVVLAVVALYDVLSRPSNVPYTVAYGEHHYTVFPGISAFHAWDCPCLVQRQGRKCCRTSCDPVEIEVEIPDPQPPGLLTITEK